MVVSTGEVGSKLNCTSGLLNCLLRKGGNRLGGNAIFYLVSKSTFCMNYYTKLAQRKPIGLKPGSLDEG